MTLIPSGLPRAVQADVISTRYFSPDVLDIRKTVGLSMEYTAVEAQQIKRENVYTTSQPTLTIEGSFTSVTGSSLSVVVQQITPVTNAKGQVSWQPDPSHYSNGAVSVDPSATSGQRFIANNLQLYPGYNQITFSGVQGGLTRSESFYVLFDKVPYLQSLLVAGGGGASTPLNEGTPVVVTEQPIALQGVAQNATKVTVGVNGGTAYDASLDRTSGNFFSSGLPLNPGANELTIIISSDNDSVTFKRTVYLYDSTAPYTGFYVLAGDAKNEPFSLQNNQPKIVKPADLAATGTSLIAQVLIPYDAFTGDFQHNVSIYLNGDYTKDLNANHNIPLLKVNPFDTSGKLLDNPAGTEVRVPGPDGVTPKYRLATFKIDNVPVSTANGGLNNVRVEVQYGSGSTLVNPEARGSFYYLPGQNQINQIYYLPKYDPTKNNGDLTGVSKEPLNGANVNSSDFYIMVESTEDRNPADKLVGQYLPLGTRTVTVTDPVAVTGSSNQIIYKVSGFASGTQKVRLNYDSNTSDYKDVTITFVSKASISISNLQNGQNISINSKSTSDTIIPVSGQYLGFPNISSAQYFVNGISDENLETEYGDEPDTSYELGVPASTSFNLKLKVSNNGPLVYGENNIVFTGVYLDSQGNSTTVKTTLTIYITDTNGSTIEQFHPNVRPDNVAFPTDLATADPTVINQILNYSTEFTYNATADKYTTSQTKYDLVARGGGVSVLNFYRGSERLFTLNFNNTQTTTGTFKMDGVDYTYELAGNEDDFILRVDDLKFDVPGSQFYTLELVNDTGARTTKKVEIERVVEPYRIISPVATSGDQIVVNKNFVHIDIEAAGATRVLIGKDEATPRTDMKDRFIYDYVGLKPDKLNTIKIQIERTGGNLTGSLSVYYTTTVGVNSEYMAEKVSNKYTVFNKGLTLSFPKATVLETIATGTDVTKYYPNNKILFGIADPIDGAVGRKDDYGNTIGRQPTEVSGQPAINIPAVVSQNFSTTAATGNFSLVSPIYWVNGGLADYQDQPVLNGLAPYSVEGTFTLFSKPRKLVPSQRGELTIAYDPNIVDDAGTTITVFRYTDNGIWQNIGGEVDTKAHTVTVPFDEFGYYKVMKLRMGYPDITNHGWARNILNALYAKGIMANLRTDAFGTDDQTTRGEFASLLVKGLNLPINSDTSLTPKSFSDVSPGITTATWSYDYIETAARAGIITGQTDGFFGPDQPITREQAAVMIARALNLKLALNDSKLSATLDKSFVDSGNMDNYAKPAIQAVSKAKIMEGSAVTVPGQKKAQFSFNPKGYMSRAEAGKIAVELLKKSTSMFPKTFN
ncbi:S-layer homology domain-containing protein [Paenibacillus yonginensis]|uniref:S-layer homology domain-containing protein n=1 Tax=Paenibacillus yonginensis TaxID=1462996 RepID=UPI0014715175|nr:S-layer homology domain-containing protein [Paenibacillus yonginensis]